MIGACFRVSFQMASTFDWEQINVPEVVESITGLIFAPVIIPLAAAVHQPTVQTAIKGGIALWGKV
jgi:hypothetical protein